MAKPLAPFVHRLSRRAVHCAVGLTLTAVAGAALAHGADASERLTQALSAEGESSYWRVTAPDAHAARQAAKTLHHALMRSERGGLEFVAALSAAEAQRLRGLGFVVQEDAAFAQAERQRIAALLGSGAPQLLGREAAAESGAATDAIPRFPCYPTVEETYQAARDLAAKYPKLASVEAIGQSWHMAQGDGGHELLVLKLSNAAVAPPPGQAKPIFFMTASVHAREYATAPLALEAMTRLVGGYGKDADATWILDHHEVHLLLIQNPDGRKIAERGISKRKNDNENFCKSISQLTGVDLNRNYSFEWNGTKGQGSSGLPCMETYRGPEAASEPETKAIEAYARRIFGDHRGPNLSDAAPAQTPGIFMDIHSYSELVLWPWGTRKTPPPNGAALQTLGRKFAHANGYMPEQSIGLYPTDGTSIDFAYGELGIASYVFEIGTDFFQSCSVYENDILPGNLPALLYAARAARAPYMQPAGPDVSALALSGGAARKGVTAGTPVTLSATLDDTRYSARGGAEPVQPIATAELFIDVPPWMPGAKAQRLTARDGAFDSPQEQASARIDTTGMAKGRHMVWVRGTDAAGNTGPVWASFLRIR